jgi:hypothetical protein
LWPKVTRSASRAFPQIYNSGGIVPRFTRQQPPSLWPKVTRSTSKRFAPLYNSGGIIPIVVVRKQQAKAIRAIGRIVSPSSPVLLGTLPTVFRGVLRVVRPWRGRPRLLGSTYNSGSLVPIRLTGRQKLSSPRAKSQIVTGSLYNSGGVVPRLLVAVQHGKQLRAISRLVVAIVGQIISPKASVVVAVQHGKQLRSNSRVIVASVGATASPKAAVTVAVQHGKQFRAASRKIVVSVGATISSKANVTIAVQHGKQLRSLSRTVTSVLGLPVGVASLVSQGVKRTLSRPWRGRPRLLGSTYNSGGIVPLIVIGKRQLRPSRSASHVVVLSTPSSVAPQVRFVVQHGKQLRSNSRVIVATAGISISQKAYLVVAVQHGKQLRALSRIIFATSGIAISPKAKSTIAVQHGKQLRAVSRVIIATIGLPIGLLSITFQGARRILPRSWRGRPRLIGTGPYNSGGLTGIIIPDAKRKNLTRGLSRIVVSASGPVGVAPITVKATQHGKQSRASSRVIVGLIGIPLGIRPTISVGTQHGKQLRAISHNIRSTIGLALGVSPTVTIGVRRNNLTRGLSHRQVPPIAGIVSVVFPRSIRRTLIAVNAALFRARQFVHLRRGLVFGARTVPSPEPIWVVNVRIPLQYRKNVRSLLGRAKSGIVVVAGVRPIIAQATQKKSFLRVRPQIIVTTATLPGVQPIVLVGIQHGKQLRAVSRTVRSLIGLPPGIASTAIKGPIRNNLVRAKSRVVKGALYNSGGLTSLRLIGRQKPKPTRGKASLFTPAFNGNGVLGVVISPTKQKPKPFRAFSRIIIGLLAIVSSKISIAQQKRKPTRARTVIFTPPYTSGGIRPVVIKVVQKSRPLQRFPLSVKPSYNSGGLAPIRLQGIKRNPFALRARSNSNPALVAPTALLVGVIFIAPQRGLTFSALQRSLIFMAPQHSLIFAAPSRVSQAGFVASLRTLTFIAPREPK